MNFELVNFFNSLIIFNGVHFLIIKFLCARNEKIFFSVNPSLGNGPHIVGLKAWHG